MTASAPVPPYPAGKEFSVIPGWFIYDEARESPSPFGAIEDNFGLEPGQTWQGLIEKIKESNKTGAARYKLVFAARHGEGWHNVAETKYSTAEWDAKWAMLTGDGEITWGPDPELTPLGEGQARSVNAAWHHQLERASQGQDAAPLPTRLFSSPFKRSCKTLELTFQGILLPPSPQKSVPSPLIKEDLREQYGDDHEAVHRSPRSTIEKNFPGYQIEEGLTEEDERFKVRQAGIKAVTPLIHEGFRENYRDEHTCDERSSKTVIASYEPAWEIDQGLSEEDERFGRIHESVDAMTYRVADALRDIFQIAQDEEVIHISSHSGVMESLWRVTGHREFKPATGAIVPLLVKWTPQSS